MHDTELAKGMLSGHHVEHEHSVKVRKLKHGYHIEKHHSDGRRTEHAATDMDDAVDHVVDHLQDGTAPPEPDEEAQGAPPPDQEGEEQPGGMA